MFAGAVSSFRSSLWVHQQVTWVNMSLSADGCLYTVDATS